MATVPPKPRREIDYPTSNGKPIAETDVHRDDMVDLIETLKRYYQAEPRVYVSGNLLLYYVEGDKRRHVSPRRLRGEGRAQPPARLLPPLGGEEGA
jgi:hypothetical protein